jgi:hypothetical protein
VTHWSPFGREFPDEAEFARRMADAPRELPEPVAFPAPPMLYLDQQQWIRLARGDDAQARHDLDRLRAASANGTVAVPLASGHYIETWHRGRWASRWALARLMWDLSRLLTLAPLHSVLPSDIAAALRAAGAPVPAEEADPPLYGRGVNHAFASPTGRLMLHETVDPDGDHGRPLTLDDLTPEQRVLWTPGPAYEWFSLAGVPADMQHADGLDMHTHRRAGRRFAAYETALASSLGARLKDQALGRVVSDGLGSIWEDIDTACRPLGVSAADVVAALDRQGGDDAVIDFVLSMPIFGLLQELRAERHRNHQQPWEANDRVDVLGLCVAAVGCAAVVTERQWAHRLERLRRRRGFRAHATRSLADALKLLGA